MMPLWPIILSAKFTCVNSHACKSEPCNPLTWDEHGEFIAVPKKVVAWEIYVFILYNSVIIFFEVSSDDDQTKLIHLSQNHQILDRSKQTSFIPFLAQTRRILMKMGVHSVPFFIHLGISFLCFPLINSLHFNSSRHLF